MGTGVDREGLRDGGEQHFVDCIAAIRRDGPGTRIEILTPDFRGKGRMERALEILATNPPDVFNHNVETVPDLYPNVRPAAAYHWSLTLLQTFKAPHPQLPTKSGSLRRLGELGLDLGVVGVLLPLGVDPLGLVLAGLRQEGGVDFPVVAADELADLFFALHHHGHRRRLHPADSGPDEAAVT